MRRAVALFALVMGCQGGDGDPDAPVVVDAAIGAPVQLTVRTTRLGRVDVAGVGCFGGCQTQVPSGTTMTLTATELGPTFRGWTGDCSGVTTCQVVMDGPKTVTAVFGRGYGEGMRLYPSSDGSIYLVGRFWGEIALLVDVPINSRGESDILVAKWTDIGGTFTYQWGVAIGGAGPDAGRSIVVDAAGNVYIAGDFSQTASFGSVSFTSAGPSDAFLARLSPVDGSVVWAKQLGGSGADAARAIALDGSGDVTIAGDFSGSADFGGGAVVSAGGQDAFVAVYGVDGTYLRSRSFGGVRDDVARDIAVSGSDLAIAGDFSDTVDFSTVVASSRGASDAFLLTLDAADGSTRRVSTLGGTGIDHGRTVAAAGTDTYIAGDFSNTVSFGGQDRVSLGDLDGFVTRVAATGAVSWVRQFGTVGFDSVNAVALNGSDVWIAGDFSGVLIPTGFNDTLRPSGQTDSFSARLDDTGMVISTRELNTLDAAYADVGLGIAVLPLLKASGSFRMPELIGSVGTGSTDPLFDP